MTDKTDNREDIRVRVSPAFQAADSNPLGGRYAFSYRIVIENRSDYTLTLRKRFWTVTDALGGVEKISSVDPADQHPVLMPGESLECLSGMHLATPWGSMEGRCEFENDLGGRVWVDIPKFDLKSDVLLQ